MRVPTGSPPCNFGGCAVKSMMPMSLLLLPPLLGLGRAFTGWVLVLSSNIASCCGIKPDEYRRDCLTQTTRARIATEINAIKPQKTKAWPNCEMAVAGCLGGWMAGWLDGWVGGGWTLHLGRLWRDPAPKGACQNSLRLLKDSFKIPLSIL